MSAFLDTIKRDALASLLREKCRREIVTRMISSGASSKEAEAVVKSPIIDCIIEQAVTATFSMMTPEEVDRLFVEEMNRASASIPVVTQPVINDHTCPHCGKNRCSKSERKCWRCEGSL